jgi:hypothetical protein
MVVTQCPADNGEEVMNGNGGDKSQPLDELETAIGKIARSSLINPLKKGDAETNSVAIMVDELSAFASQMARYSSDQGEFRSRITNDYLKAVTSLTTEWANKILASLRHEMRDIENGIGQLPEHK